MPRLLQADQSYAADRLALQAMFHIRETQHRVAVFKVERDGSKLQDQVLQNLPAGDLQLQCEHTMSSVPAMFVQANGLRAELSQQSLNSALRLLPQIG